MENRQCASAAPVRETRNYGIDLLRIVSMFSIVLLHVLGEGGVGQHVKLFSSNYYGYLTLRFLNEFAVDAFGMVSGYVMCRSKPKLSRLMGLWLEVLFYSAGISLLFVVFNRPAVPILRAELYNMIFPVSGGRYWYISCYFCMFFFIPVLNAGIEKLSKRELFGTLFGLFFLICVAGGLNTSRKDPFAMNYGFSTAWLCVLYLIGGFYRKYEKEISIRVWQALLGIAACVLATVCFKHWMDVNRWRLSYTLDWMLMSNVSVTYTLTAFFMLTLFARIRPGARAQRVIRLLSPAALGVYLIHVHPMVWTHMLSGSFAFLAKLPWVMMLAAAAGIAAVIFSACILVDLGRIYLFRWIRIEKICVKAESLLRRFG